MGASRGTWNEDRIARLKGCFDAGLSCSEIACEIGVTRNAVIGKLSRLGLSRPRSAGTPRPERGHLPKFRRPRIMTQRRILMAIRPAAPGMAVESGQRCSLLDLGEERCRWPINDPGSDDFCFCGNAPVHGLPYCAGHARMAYRPAGRERAAS